MAGCFGNHWIDRAMEKQLMDYLDSKDEDDYDDEDDDFEEEDCYPRWWPDLEEESYSDADPGL